MPSRLLAATRLLSVRSRLIAAFVTLFGVTLLVAAVGVLGMRANQKALDEYQANVVPEIARVLELSERVAQVAAAAPGMTDADSTELLSSDTELLQGLLGDIRRLTLSLPEKTEEKLTTSNELDGIDRDLTHLLVLSGRLRELKGELNRLRQTVDGVGNDIYRQRTVIAQQAPTLLNVWVTLSSALQAPDDAALGRAEGDSEALWLQVNARGEAVRQPVLARALQQLSDGPHSVFSVRRAFINNELRITYLTMLMRGHAEQLGGKAARYVTELRQVAGQRGDALRRLAASSESGLWLLGAVGVALALAGVVYVGRVLAKLQSMTAVMGRLAAGDTAPRIPSTDRRDEIGELARAFEVFRTTLLEKQQLAQGLDSQRRLLQMVFHSMNDGLSVHAPDGSLVAWNPTFARLLGLSDADLHVGMGLAELRHTLPQMVRWRAVSRETAARSANGRTRIAASAELHLADQRILEFHSQGMPDGGWVAVCRDLTSRRAVEAELRQAQKMDVLGQLTGGVAHDFNNFLVAILGNLELLEPRLRADADAQALAERARRAAERASRLTRRLLAFARRQPLQAEDIEVDALLAEMLDLVEYAVGPKIEVVIDVPDEPLWLHADRGQLENAILNLALNSAAAMPDGGTLTLEVAAVAEPEQRPGITPAVALRVTDTGSGIPTVLLDKVMEPFFTTKAPGEGSGLGLSSVYGFVRQSGGDMKISSEVGHGTTVELLLPAGLPMVEASRPEVHRPMATVIGTRVLVVEDDASVRDTILAQLTALGAMAFSVATVAEALGWLGQHGPVGLVLSDISLGAGGNGIALAAQIERRWPAQRVVLMSGLPLEAHQAHPDWREGRGFLAKPFGLEALAGVL